MIEKMSDKLPLTYRKLHTALELRFSQADDPHFVDITITRLKTGLIVRSHYIILPDLPQWIGVFEADGWQRFNNEYSRCNATHIAPDNTDKQHIEANNK